MTNAKEGAIEKVQERLC